MWRVFLIFAILVPGAFTNTQFIPRPLGLEWSGRLVGGRYADKGQFPHMASLKTIEINQHYCGSSIISDHWIGKIFKDQQYLVNSFFHQSLSKSDCCSLVSFFWGGVRENL